VTTRAPTSAAARGAPLACLAALLAACDPAAGPPASPAGSAEPLPPAASAEPFARAADPGGSTFDYGEVKTAAEYLAEPRFEAADLARGELLSLACAACHTFPVGGNTLIGPNLHAVFGRPAGTLPGFEYSPALKASGLVWTPRSLEAWLANPQRFVQGTTMAFTGLQSVDDRRDLIAYLLHATD
jgi:cytochrome c